MTVDTQVTWLTQAYDRLKHELDELIANRPVIAAEINARREEGDLRATVATTPPARSRASRRPDPPAPGTAAHRPGRCRPVRVGHRLPRDVLTIQYDDDPSDVEKLLLGSREEGAHGDLQVISPHSPLGAALLGARVGETREYRLPDGGMKVTLVAEPFGLRFLAAAEPYRRWRRGSGVLSGPGLAQPCLRTVPSGPKVSGRPPAGHSPAARGARCRGSPGSPRHPPHRGAARRDP